MKPLVVEVEVVQVLLLTAVTATSAQVVEVLVEDSSVAEVAAEEKVVVDVVENLQNQDWLPLDLSSDIIDKNAIE